MSTSELDEHKRAGGCGVVRINRTEWEQRARLLDELGRVQVERGQSRVALSCSELLRSAEPQGRAALSSL